MTRFEKEYKIIQKDPYEAREILEKRQIEINMVRQRQRLTRNRFVWGCATQELEQLEKEYRMLDSLI